MSSKNSVTSIIAGVIRRLPSGIAEEDAQIERYVQFSGLTKQDYITRRLTHKDVVVQNPRVFKALRNQLAEVLSCKELRTVTQSMMSCLT